MSSGLPTTTDSDLRGHKSRRFPLVLFDVQKLPGRYVRELDRHACTIRACTHLSLSAHRKRNFVSSSLASGFGDGSLSSSFK